MAEEPADLGEELENEEEHDDAIRAVASSMVSAWGYERESEQLQVLFTNGLSHSYDCSPDQWEEAKTVVSPGRWLHQNILGR